MRPITQIKVVRANTDDAIIELMNGDLAAIPLEHAVDVLVISAFPNDYTPVPGTLIGNLTENGLSVEDIAINHKEAGADLREQLGCWLSEELPPEYRTRFNFKRILCFEPRSVGNKPEEVVINVFRCINNFIIPAVATTETKELRSNLKITKVAMPILAAGNQKVPRELMLPAILEGAIFWLKQGLPLTHLKLVLYEPKPGDLQFGQHVFEQFRTGLMLNANEVNAEATTVKQQGWKQKLSNRIMELLDDKIKDHFFNDLYAVADDEEKEVLDRLVGKMENNPALYKNTEPGKSKDTDTDFDLFISYPHVHQEEVIEFVAALITEFPNLKVFHDRECIPAGGLWIKKISDAIQSSEHFIAILSPQYSSSEVCWDEFQCAKLKEYNTKKSVIKTISFYEDKNLPPIMGIYSWIDCTVGDVKKLKEAAKKVL